MRQRIFQLVVFVSAVSLLTAASSRADDRDAALELLKLSIDCPGDSESIGSDYKFIMRYGSVSSRNVLRIMSDFTGYKTIIPYPSDPEIGSVTKQRNRHVANFSDIHKVSIKNKEVILVCKKNILCFDNSPVSWSECKKYPNKVDACLYDDNVALSANNTFTWRNLCVNQIDNIVAALRFLIDTSETQILEEPGIAYVPSGAPGGKSIPIMKDPTSKSKILGGIPGQASVIMVVECVKEKNNSKQSWCRTNWSGLDGWVSMSRLKIYEPSLRR